MTYRLESSRTRWTLDEAMQFIGAKWVGEPCIKFDPHLTPQYRIRRAVSHDGTMLFSMGLVAKTLGLLFTRSSYFTPMGLPPEGMWPEYTIGPIRRFSVYGSVKLPTGTLPGERECVVIPVRCEYVPITLKDNRDLLPHLHEHPDPHAPLEAPRPRAGR